MKCYFGKMTLYLNVSHVFQITRCTGWEETKCNAPRDMLLRRREVLVRSVCFSYVWFTQSYLYKTLTIYIEQTVHLRDIVPFRLFILVMNRTRCNKKSLTFSFKFKNYFAPTSTYRSQSIQRCRMTLQCPIRLLSFHPVQYAFVTLSISHSKYFRSIKM